MSHSGTDNDGKADIDGVRAGQELLQMLAEGRSYSGRERNCCFLNTNSDSRSGSKFATISAASGLDFIEDGRAIAVVDWDHDGDLDMWQSFRNAPRMRLLLNNYSDLDANESERQGNFVSLVLQGTEKTTTRDAIGARVEIFTDAEGYERNVQTLRAGEGFISQSSKVLTFGLGKASSVKKIAVHWPGVDFDSPEEFTIEEVNQRFLLVQGSGTATKIETDREIKLAPGQIEPNPRTVDGRIRYQLLLPAPTADYKGLDNIDHFGLPESDGPTLVMLWSSDCAICQRGLNEISDRSNEIRKAGLNILALSMDLVTAEGSEFAARKLLSTTKFPFDAGFANAEYVDNLQAIHDHLMPLHTHLPIPSSYLIDKEGRISVIYKGEAKIDDVLDDVNHSALTAVERFVRSAALPGRSINHDVTNSVRLRQTNAVRGLFAQENDEAGNDDIALAEYRELLKYREDYSHARYSIGRILSEQGKTQEAVAFYLESLKILPEDALIHTNLGNIYANEQKLELAEPHFKAAAKFEATSAEYFANLGNIQMHLNKLDEAKSQYEKAIELSPKFADAYLNLGNIAFTEQKLDRAEKYYADAIRLDPSLVMAHLNMGNLLATEKKYAEAIKSYQEALRLNPELQEAKVNMAQAIALQNRSK